MSYQVTILRRAQKELAGLPQEAYRQARNSILALAENPLPAGCRKLTGREGWRIRVGDYRIIYRIDDAARIVTVLHVGHRRDVYR